MSFETSDTPDLPYPAFELPATEMPGDATDHYQASDIIPDQEAETISPEPPDQFNPWKMKQIHFIGDKTIEGDHPDPLMRAFIEEGRTTSLDMWRQRQEALDTIPTRNEEFADTIATARTLLHRDFGEVAASAPIKIVDAAAAVNAGILYDGDAGRLVHGELVVAANSQLSGELEKREILGTTLHEGAHGRAEDGRYIETATYKAPPLDNDPLGAWQTRKTAAFTMSSGAYETVVDPYKPIFIGNSFFEEGFAESYRGRTLEKHLGGVSITGTNTGFDRLAFTDRPEDFGHYDRLEDVVYVPWKYARNTKDGTTHAYVSTGSLAAYGLDILDERLPGLYDEIQHMADEPGLRAHVQQRIDGLQPGLYSFLRSLDYDKLDFHYGLNVIMRETGMLDRKS